MVLLEGFKGEGRLGMKRRRQPSRLLPNREFKPDFTKIPVLCVQNAVHPVLFYSPLGGLTSKPSSFLPKSPLPHYQLPSKLETLIKAVISLGQSAKLEGATREPTLFLLTCKGHRPDHRRRPQPTDVRPPCSGSQLPLGVRPVPGGPQQ